MVRLINFRAEDEIETALLASISSGKFNDAQEFLEHLIKNYYAELKFGMAATDIKNEWDQPLTLIDDKTEDVLKGIVREARSHIDSEEDKGKKYIEIKNLSQADTYRENHAGLIYHWQNRILPIKFILTVLGAMIVTKKTAMITIDQLQEAVISDTESFRKKIEGFFKYPSRDSTQDDFIFDKKMWRSTLTGFPLLITPAPWEKPKDEGRKPTQIHRSRKRFCEHFLGRYIDVKKRKTLVHDDKSIMGMAGACFEMGLLKGYKQTTSREIIILPTKLGLAFLCENNPMLNYIYDNKKLPARRFSKYEKALFKHHILPRFKLEKEIIAELFKKKEIKSTNELQRIFHEKQRKFLEKLLVDELGVKKDTIKFTYTKPSEPLILESDYINLIEEKTTAKLEFTNKTVRADDQKKITESFNDWVHYALVYQKSHVIVMVSRLTELGFCKKSNTKPTIFTFLADDWADVDRHSARFKEIESLV
tara:strand:- start:32 stop:1465 length:1434 start_codon:yes stop_codon:yes gene_type:complete